MDAARLEMETTYFGTLNMCRAFAPLLAANGGGAIVNMLSWAAPAGGRHPSAVTRQRYRLASPVPPGK